MQYTPLIHNALPLLINLRLPSHILPHELSFTEQPSRQ